MSSNDIVTGLLDLSLSQREKSFEKYSELFTEAFKDQDPIWKNYRNLLWELIVFEKQFNNATNRKYQAKLVSFAFKILENSAIPKMLRFAENDELHKSSLKVFVRHFLRYYDENVLQLTLKSLTRDGESIYSFIKELINSNEIAYLPTSQYQSLLYNILKIKNPGQELKSLIKFILKKIPKHQLNWFLSAFRDIPYVTLCQLDWISRVFIILEKKEKYHNQFNEIQLEISQSISKINSISKHQRILDQEKLIILNNRIHNLNNILKNISNFPEICSISDALISDGDQYEDQYSYIERELIKTHRLVERINLFSDENRQIMNTIKGIEYLTTIFSFMEENLHNIIELDFDNQSYFTQTDEWLISCLSSKNSEIRYRALEILSKFSIKDYILPEENFERGEIYHDLYYEIILRNDDYQLLKNKFTSYSDFLNFFNCNQDDSELNPKLCGLLHEFSTFGLNYGIFLGFVKKQLPRQLILKMSKEDPDIRNRSLCYTILSHNQYWINDENELLGSLDYFIRVLNHVVNALIFDSDKNVQINASKMFTGLVNLLFYQENLLDELKSKINGNRRLFQNLHQLEGPFINPIVKRQIFKIIDSEIIDINVSNLHEEILSDMIDNFGNDYTKNKSDILLIVQSGIKRNNQILIDNMERNIRSIVQKSKIEDINEILKQMTSNENVEVRNKAFLLIKKLK
ncbi:MAG: hypothetical protein INQ03_07025 [Candidatus Heimdallarchaeota archaeon]|nr:hypothetical protein [Candidatus Heimdallarchaeota archaeon]